MHMTQGQAREYKSRGWKWVVTLTYNDTVKPPKMPGMVAIETIHKDDASKDFEVAASETRNDVNILVTEL